MSQSTDKPKLSEVMSQEHADKADKVRKSTTFFPKPPPPKPQTPPTPEPGLPLVETPAPESLAEKIEKGESDFAEGKGTVLSADELQTKPVPSEPTLVDKPMPIKTSRTRRSGSLTIDEVISAESPKGEPYPRQVRISEHHHKLLRKLAFTHEKTMNHILYNLLDQLDQADQRDQQKGE